jgi:hypothetical protein
MNTEETLAEMEQYKARRRCLKYVADLKNGDGLAPVLFNLALDWLIILKWKLVALDLTRVSR